MYNGGNVCPVKHNKRLMRKPLLLSLIALVLVACGTPRRACVSDSGFRDELERNYESAVYRQKNVMLVDARGDANLIRQLDTIPIKLFDYLIHRSLPQIQALTETDRKSFKIGKTVPIDNGRLLNKCAEIIRQYSPEITPYMGHEHVWSPEAKKYLYYGYWHRLWRRIAGLQKDYPAPMLMRSKLFFCLACGWTSRYCITGREEALTERILSYPDYSVEPHQLFAESYILNQGNIYFTFLTCENVLAVHPHRKERNDDSIQKKLCYIRHDSKEMGDNYGAWYHFFGIALYGMFRSGAKALFVADTESLGSFLMEGSDRQEALINHYGALFGRRFRIMIENGSWQTVPGPGGRTDYLLPNPAQGS